MEGPLASPDPGRMPGAMESRQWNCANRFPLLGALLGLLATLTAPVAFAGLGRTPGSAWVSDDGEASYSIPVDIPPGTNGLTPAVSIDYRHRTRGGLLGVGWSIGGLSQVTRCARTLPRMASPSRRASSPTSASASTGSA